MKLVIGLGLLGAWAWPLAAPAAQADVTRLARPAQTSPAREIAVKEPVGALTLIKVGDGLAVIRFGTGSLEKVRVNDVVGATKAVVKEIGAARIVLDEAFTGVDGRPNRALIVIKEGERGGTRYLQRADEPRITGTKPAPVTTAEPGVKPLPKKPGRM